MTPAQDSAELHREIDTLRAELEEKERRKSWRKLCHHLLFIAAGAVITLMPMPSQYTTAKLLAPFGPSVALEVLDQRYRL